MRRSRHAGSSARSRRWAARAVLAALALVLAPAAGSAQPPSQPSKKSAYPSENGWTSEERRDFYHRSLGSELFPLSWARALYGAKTERPFLEGLDRFGFIDDPYDSSALPIGLTVAPAKLDPPTMMLGMNCAACHVAYNYTGGLIDGAPNVLMDLVGFNAALARSVARIAEDPGAFAAFQLRLIGQDEERDRLKTAHPRAFFVLEAAAGWDASNSAHQMRDALVAALGPVFQPKSASWPLPGDISGMPRLSAPITPEFVAPLSGVRAAARASLGAFVDANIGAGAPLGDGSGGRPGGYAGASGGPFAAAQARAALVEDLAGHFIETIWYLKQAAAFLLKQDQLRNIPGGTPAGPGRVDDFRLARNLIVNEAPLALPATSPTSIPVLWLTDRVKWLGWDGNADSTMQRNIATAIAIGAAFDHEAGNTSVPPRDVYRLEVIGSKIRPPRWPYSIDFPTAARGKIHYDRLCARCHVDPAAAAPSETAPNWLPDLLFEPAPADPGGKPQGPPDQYVGTDPNRALNFVADFNNRSAGARFDVGLGLLQKALYYQNGIGPWEAQKLLGDRAEKWRPTGKYAPRPLVSVWAAAPYLHNDSVPTLYDLLLPAARRPVTFRRGGRNHDNVKVGYREPGPDEPGFVFDVRLSGNSNKGHEFGVELSDDQRRELIEYLKTR